MTNKQKIYNVGLKFYNMSTSSVFNKFGNFVKSNESLQSIFNKYGFNLFYKRVGRNLLAMKKIK